jgi:putative NADPH-quinone reductase
VWWYGNPAIKKGYITRLGIVLNNDLTDKSGRKYKLIDGEPF